MEKNPSSKRYPPELKERAVRMVGELRHADPNDQAVISRVARQLGVGTESLRQWVKQTEVDTGRQRGTTTAEHEELVHAAQGGQGAAPGHDLWQAAAGFFGAELDRRRTK